MQNSVIKRYDYIDALRGFAILGVILVHTNMLVTPTNSYLYTIMTQGARGVQLFYILSALSLFLSMNSRKNHDNRPILSFYIRRFFRIAPAFYCAIIIYTCYSGMSARYWAPNGIEWWYLPLTAVFLNGWFPETITSVVPGGWSIAIEMTFYMIMPYLFIKLNNIKSTLWALFLSLILSKLAAYVATNVIFVDSLLPPELLFDFKFLWFFSQFPFFILGILLYHIIVKYPHCDKKIVLTIILALSFLFAVFLNAQTSPPLLPWYVLSGVAFLMFSLLLHYSPQKLFVNKFTMFIGKLSFSIYLVHTMVISILNMVFVDTFLFVWNANVSFVLAFFLILLVSVCISYFTHKIIEIPGMNLGKYIVKKLQ